ncbi:MAG: choice-of-anchor U domain-containing protein [candidate division WOR-3 bacterium]
MHDSIVNVAMIAWLTIYVEEPNPIEAMVHSSTGTGNVSFVSDAGIIGNLTAISESDLPTEGKPAFSFPHGFFSFNITGLTPGQTVNVTIIFPSDIPVTAQYWKYHTPEGWYQIPIKSNDGDNIIIIQLTDGGIGDDDGIANGVIVDAEGPGIPKPPVGGKIVSEEISIFSSLGSRILAWLAVLAVAMTLAVLLICLEKGFKTKAKN